MENLNFTHPEPRPEPKRTLIPVFLPGLGCKTACVYCDQSQISGEGVKELEQIYADLQRDLSGLADAGRGPYELGFFGGTFTFLPKPWPERFVSLAAKFKDSGLLSRLRCSTSPAAVELENLRVLRGLGLDMIELGVQSFYEPSLNLCRRGYGREQAVQACLDVKRAGLDLGIQLMPGLPGLSLSDFRADVSAACELKPRVVRLYPCQVIRKTCLAGWYKSGLYTVLSLGRCVPLLAYAALKFWKAGVRLGRIGLTQTPSLEQARLAGPWHPNLGGMARGLALFIHLRGIIAGLGVKPQKLAVPKRYQGEIFGQAGELKPRYQRLGLGGAQIGFEEREEFALEY